MKKIKFTITPGFKSFNSEQSSNDTEKSQSHALNINTNNVELTFMDDYSESNNTTEVVLAVSDEEYEKLLSSKSKNPDENWSFVSLNLNVSTKTKIPSFSTELNSAMKKLQSFTDENVFIGDAIVKEQLKHKQAMLAGDSSFTRSKQDTSKHLEIKELPLEEESITDLDKTLAFAMAAHNSNMLDPKKSFTYKEQDYIETADQQEFDDIIKKYKAEKAQLKESVDSAESFASKSLDEIYEMFDSEKENIKSLLSKEEPLTEFKLNSMLKKFRKEKALEFGTGSFFKVEPKHTQNENRKLILDILSEVATGLLDLEKSEGIAKLDSESSDKSILKQLDANEDQSFDQLFNKVVENTINEIKSSYDNLLRQNEEKRKLMVTAKKTSDEILNEVSEDLNKLQDSTEQQFINKISGKYETKEEKLARLKEEKETAQEMLVEINKQMKELS